jgi:hypothetical protein
MQVSKEVITSRLSAVSNTGGSVAATAAWCAVHAYQAGDVMSVWSALVTAPTTETDVRVALVYVVHEMALSCVAKGPQSDAAKALMQTMGKVLPAALVKAVQIEAQGSAQGDAAPAGEFAAATSSVLNWWLAAHVFPAAWVTQLITATNVGSRDVGAAIGRGGASLPPELQNVFKLYQRYQTAKAAAHKLETDGADGQAVTSAREDALRRLVPLLKALTGDETSSNGSIVGQLNADMTSLKGGAAAGEELVDPLAGFFDE